MVLFTYTFQVNEDGSERPPVDEARLWDLLTHKAAHPVAFVPSITGAEVVEKFDDGFVREIVLRDEVTVRERVRLEPHRRIVFEQLDNPDLVAITNEIGRDESDRLTFTFTATLSAHGLARSRVEAGFVAENDLLFYDTARATINTIRLLTR